MLLLYSGWSREEQRRTNLRVELSRRRGHTLRGYSLRDDRGFALQSNQSTRTTSTVYRPQRASRPVADRRLLSPSPSECSPFEGAKHCRECAQAALQGSRVTPIGASANEHLISIRSEEDRREVRLTAGPFFAPSPTISRSTLVTMLTTACSISPGTSFARTPSVSMTLARRAGSGRSREVMRRGSNC